MPASASTRSPRLPVALLLGLALLRPCAAQAPAFADERPRLPGREGPGLAGAAVDVDGDSLVDVVRVTPAGLEVALQDAAGSFRHSAPPLPLGLPAGAGVVSLCAGALRPGASVPDLVVGVTGADSVLLRNDGRGRFAQQVPSPLPRPLGFSGATTQVLVGDLDGAVGDDVLVLHDGALPQLFLLQPSGAFAERGRAWFPTGFFPQSPAGVLADFTGSGFPDLVLVRRGVQSIPILLASQAGTQLAVQPGAFPTAPFPASTVAAGDVTHDGFPDVLLGSHAASGASLVALANNGQGAFSPSAVVSFSSGGIADVAVAPIDADALNDLAILQTSGAVDVALARNGRYATATNVLPPGQRAALALVDFENDGDRDLWVLGAELEDALLLGDGGGKLFATEEVTMPAGPAHGPTWLALVDVTGEGDPDLMGYDARGNPIGFVNDGSARFSERRSLLPGFAAAVRDVAALAGARPGRFDLAVLGTRLGATRADVHILARQSGRFVDETASRWPQNVGSSVEVMAAADLEVGSAATSGFDDIVTVDDQGGLWLFRNQAGVFSASMAFGFATVLAPAQVLIGHVDGDGRMDVVVLRRVGPPAVFLRQANGSFREIPQPVLGSFPSRQGVLAELTGDGVADLLIVALAPASRLFLLRGLGDGTFVDDSARAPAPLPGGLSSVATIGGSAQVPPAAIVLGSSEEPDVMFARQGASFAARSVLPPHGSLRTTGFLVGDVDVDGDDDLVVSRAATLPRVLFAQTLQLTSLGVGQLGRPARLRARAPHVGAAALLVAAQPARLPFAPFGILRLDPASLAQLAQVPVPVTGIADLTIATSPSWPELELPLQMAYLDTVASAVALSNLEHLRVVRY